MQKHLYSYFFSLLLLFSFFVNSNRSFGQTVALANETTNVLANGTLTGYTNNLCVYGLKVTVTVAAESIGTINILNGATSAALSTIFTNGRLYSTSTAGYNSASPGTLVGTVTFNSNYITISGMGDNYTAGQTKYYYLVVDCITTSSSGNFQPAIEYGQSPTAVISTGGTNYNTYSDYEGYYSFAAGTPPAVTASNLTSGLTSNSSSLITSQSGVVAFGFSLTTTSNLTFTSFNINSSSTSLSSYFSSAVLYRCTTNNYSTGTKTAVGTAAIGSTYVTVTGSENVNNTTQYYFLVLTCASSFTTVPANIAFSFNSGQSSNALATSSTSYNTLNVFGNTYNLNSSVVTITSTTNGISSGTVTANQTGLVLFGFGVQSTAATTFSQININSNNTALSSYFGNGKLYYSTTNNYTTGSPVLAGTVTFSGGIATATLTANNAFTAGQTRYYFLVADNIGVGSSTTLAFNFTSGQSSNALVQSSPVSSYYNTFSITGNTFTFPSANLLVTGANSTSTNGITTGALTYGETDIVVFGFGAQSYGTTPNFTEFQIQTSGNENQYFSNPRLYRSTTNVFPGGTPLYTSSAFTFGGGYFVCTVNETIPSGTIYYYWLVVDYTVTTGSAGTFSCDFANGQGQIAFYPSPYSTSYNTYTVAGNVFTVGGIYDWVGTSSTSFATAGNFRINGSTVSTAPGANDVVRIGVVAYQTPDFQPSVTASTAIGSLIFGTNNTPTLTVGGTSAATLTIANGLITNASSTATLTNSLLNNGTINLSTAAASSVLTSSSTINSTVPITNSGDILIQTGSALNLTGTYGTLTNTSTGTVENAGTGTLSVAGALTNAGNITQAGTGTITFSSTVGNTGTIAQTSTGILAITGALTNSAGAHLNQTSSGALNFGSTISNTGTINQSGSGSITLTGSNTLTNNNGGIITLGSGTNSFGGGIMNSSGGNFTSGTGPTTFTGSFTNPGTFTGGSGTYNFNNTSTFSNTGTFTLAGGVANIMAATVTNSGTFTVSSGTVNFGFAGNQAISNTNATTPVTFSNVTFSGSGTKSLSSGKFVVASNGTVTLSTTGTTILSAGTALLTLNSDATGSASVAILPSGTSITGTVNVQRFVTGGSLTYRGYRTLSSPVTDPTSPMGFSYYNMSFLKGSGSYLSGTGGTASGFDVTGSPNIFLYNESVTPNNGSLSSGNFRAVTAINNTNLYSIGTVDGNFNLSVGNGIFFFFRGNNGTVATTVPNNVTFTALGTLNQGQYTVNDWYTSTPTNLLGYTGTGTGTNSAVRGFNLVGNPYPCSIDWDTAFAGTATTGIYAPNTDLSIYIYNTTTKNYSVYKTTSSSGGTASGSVGGTNVIPEGQGFFVRATTTGAKLVFNETAKLVSNPTTLLLNSAPAGLVTDQHLRLQLYKDSINKDETVILFNPAASAAFVLGEDASYLTGAGVLSLSNMTSDSQPVAINEMPFPKTTQTIPLNVTGTGDGAYQLNMTQVVNIPNLFDVWLKDAYMKDSLDIKHNPSYAFSLLHSDTGSISAKRFTLVIRQNAAYDYHLLSFTGTKAIGGAQLNWTTENEENFTTFIVQRSTNGGKTYTNLSTITSSGGGAYNYLDTSPAAGVNQYRLEQIDYDGNITYSNIVQLVYGTAGSVANTEGTINIYPNPIKDIINLTINSTNNASGSYSINILSSNGSAIKTFSSQQVPWQTSLSQLAPGVYLIKVFNNTDNSLVGTNKFIKL